MAKLLDCLFIKSLYFKGYNKITKLLFIIFLSLFASLSAAMQSDYDDSERVQEEDRYIHIVPSLPSRFQIDSSKVECEPEKIHRDLQLINKLVSIGQIYCSGSMSPNSFIKCPNSLVVHLNLLYCQNNITKCIEGGYLNYDDSLILSDHSLSLSRDKATVFISGYHSNTGIIYDSQDNRLGSEREALTYFLNSGALKSIYSFPELSISTTTREDNITKGHTEEHFTDLFFSNHTTHIIQKLLQKSTSSMISEEEHNEKEEHSEPKHKKIKSPLKLVLLFDLGSYYFICKGTRDKERESCRSLLFALANGSDQIKRPRLKQKVDKYFKSVSLWKTELKDQGYPIEDLKIFFRYSFAFSPGSLKSSYSLINQRIFLEDEKKVEVTYLPLADHKNSEIFSHFIEFYQSKIKRDGLFEKQEPTEENKKILEWLRLSSNFPENYGANDEEIQFYKSRKEAAILFLKMINETDEIKRQNRLGHIDSFLNSLEKTDYRCQCGKYIECGRKEPFENQKRLNNKNKKILANYRQKKQQIEKRPPQFYNMWKGIYEGKEVIIKSIHNKEYEIRIDGNKVHYNSPITRRYALVNENEFKEYIVRIFFPEEENKWYSLGGTLLG